MLPVVGLVCLKIVGKKKPGEPVGVKFPMNKVTLEGILGSKEIDLPEGFSPLATGEIITEGDMFLVGGKHNVANSFLPPEFQPVFTEIGKKVSDFALVIRRSVV